MSARSIGSGSISFGLVSIPVKLFSATQSSARVSFNLLHKKCGSRLKQQYICPVDDGEVVTRDQMVKGYEFSRDQYVTFTPEELEALEEQASQTIDISEFVPLEKIDPVYFERPYYLSPDRGGEKAYRLLVEAMRQTGRAALAKYAARGKGYLVLLRPAGDGLLMQELHYADEVRPFSEVPVGRAEIREPELQLAIQLINQIASDEFRPDAYEDEVRKRTLALIQTKVSGKEISLAPPAPARAQVIDLMEALKESLAKAEAPAAPEERKPARRAARQAGEAGERPAKVSKK